MTTTTDIGTAPSARVLSTRTRAAYAGDWALFTDHCAVTGSPALPADPRTVVEFLSSCPAAPATRRRRVAAVDHHHTGAGEPFQPTERDRDAVEAALRGLPSHGWTQGMFGRRDRCLLVLSQLAGVPYRHLATMTRPGAPSRTPTPSRWTRSPPPERKRSPRTSTSTRATPPKASNCPALI